MRYGIRDGCLPGYALEDVFSTAGELGFDSVELDIGAEFEPLLRFRGFYTKPGVAAERRAYLEAACKLAFDSESFQAFNKKKYMHLIDSYRDSDGARILIADSVKTYKKVFKELGILK